MASRYLFPGVAAAIVFVVFPMIYTVAIGFTNYSSRNLLDYERARQFFLDETFRAEGPGYGFTVHHDARQFRVRLVDQDDEAKVFLSAPLALKKPATLEVEVLPEAGAGTTLSEALTMKEVIAEQSDLKGLTLRLPDGKLVRMTSLREFAPVQAAYKSNPDGTLTSAKDDSILKPNFTSGYFEAADGTNKEPGFKVGVGLAHYKRILTDEKFRAPFGRVFI